MSELAWKKVFAQWPGDMPRRGVLVTTLGEQVPFDGYLTGEEVVLVERQTPDTVGARALIVPYGNIAVLKLVDVIKPKSLEAMGLRGTLTRR